jgi:hypothetical protein
VALADWWHAAPVGCQWWNSAACCLSMAVVSRAPPPEAARASFMSATAAPRRPSANGEHNVPFYLAVQQRLDRVTCP